MKDRLAKRQIDERERDEKQNTPPFAPEIEEKTGGYEEEITGASTPPRTRNLLIFQPKDRVAETKRER